jgi:uncharacterized protein GlcG (DUF336 family)
LAGVFRQLAVLGLLSLSSALPCAAEDLTASDLDLLLKMAVKARDVCLAKGYPTTVSVVTNDGQPAVVLRTPGAPIHTIQNSFNKAYTVMTLGPIENQDSSSGLAAQYKTSTTFGLAPEPLAHMSFSGGGVLVRLHGQPVGGLAISGSPNGTVDESCARAGRDAIR